LNPLKVFSSRGLWVEFARTYAAVIFTVSAIFVYRVLVSGARNMLRWENIAYFAEMALLMAPVFLVGVAFHYSTKQRDGG
jgi:hypothetical protein